MQMSNVANQILTLVVENLPFISGAIGVGSPNILIYTGALAFPPPVNNIIAFTDRPLSTGITATGNYRLCVFEFPSMLPNTNGIG